jgi:hypothetical protein
VEAEVAGAIPVSHPHFFQIYQYILKYRNMSESGSTFEHDCGMDKATWRLRVEKDFGVEAADTFEVFVEEFTEALQRADESVDAITNTDLLLHQMLPEVFPDPMVKKIKGS